MLLCQSDRNVSNLFFEAVNAPECCAFCTVRCCCDCAREYCCAGMQRCRAVKHVVLKSDCLDSNLDCHTCWVCNFGPAGPSGPMGLGILIVPMLHWMVVLNEHLWQALRTVHGTQNFNTERGQSQNTVVKEKKRILLRKEEWALRLHKKRLTCTYMYEYIKKRFCNF